MGRLGWPLVVMALSGCAPDVVFRHPVSGDVAVCRGYPDRGPFANVAQGKQAECQDDLFRNGYERVPAR